MTTTTAPPTATTSAPPLPTVLIETPTSLYWRRTFLGLSLTFGVLATLLYVFRLYASARVARVLRVDDFIMGLAILLMWGEEVGVFMSK